MTIEEIQQTWDNLMIDHKNLGVNWLAVFNLRTNNSNIVITENHRVSVHPEKLLENLAELLKKFKLQVLGTICINKNKKIENRKT